MLDSLQSGVPPASDQEESVRGWTEEEWAAVEAQLAAALGADWHERAAEFRRRYGRKRRWWPESVHWDRCPYCDRPWHEDHRTLLVSSMCCRTITESITPAPRMASTEQHANGEQRSSNGGPSSVSDGPGRWWA